jgi:L-alanine-DL-glutamate epimerase-like enolase superfamily enzyme
MNIARAEAHPVRLKLREPYQIAYGRFETADMVFLRLETRSGWVGWGCAAPDPHVTGETAAGVLDVLRDQVAPALAGQNAHDVAALHQTIAPLTESFPAARTALDLARWDLIGKRAGLPVHRLLGGYRDRTITSVTIGIMDEEETVRRARAYLAQGFRALKLKGGLDPEADAARAIRIRETTGPDMLLWFDANQGYDPDQTLAFIQIARPAGLSFVEQPTPHGRPDLMGLIRNRTDVPIMADESVCSSRDVFELARLGQADLFNLKLVKFGGLTPCLDAESVARSAGLGVMVGCMDESALSIAAGLHLVLARPGAVYADLDGHLDLIDDPFADTVHMVDGYLYPSDQPGFGPPPKGLA